MRKEKLHIIIPSFGIDTPSLQNGRANSQNGTDFSRNDTESSETGTASLENDIANLRNGKAIWRKVAATSPTGKSQLKCWQKSKIYNFNNNEKNFV